MLNESLDNKILSLYALGMSYEAITEHLSDMYGLEVSAAKISLITDQLVPIITEWRNRSLDAVYPIVFLDAMHFKVREDGKVISKAFYSALGVNKEGRKDILGVYLSENEGAHFWLGVLNDLRARGIEDILIASIDGLKGFPEAIAQVFPKTEIQLCIVHPIRNSLKYVVSRDQKAFMTDLKLVYKATSKELAEHRLLELDEKWGKNTLLSLNPGKPIGIHFPNILSTQKNYVVLFTRQTLWRGFHRQIRKYTKNKGAFTSENALLKLIYCACQKVLEKWYQPMHNWGLIASQLQIYFDGRLNLELR